MISKATPRERRELRRRARPRPAPRAGRRLRGGRGRRPLPRARPGPSLPGVRARFERRHAGGAVVTQLAQPWRRGEYAPVIRLLRGRRRSRSARMISAGSIEGGDVIIVEPGKLLIGNGEERTEARPARQLAGWFEAEGWEVRIEPIPEPLRPHRRARLDPRAEARRGLRRGRLHRAVEVAARRRASRSSRSPSPTPSGSASTRSRSATTA